MNKKGFTLIEVIFVMVIMSILAIVAIGYKGARDKQDTIAEDVKLNPLNREKSDTINTVKPVEVTKPVPQTVKDTVKPVFKPDFVITCNDRDSLMSKCVLNLNQRDVRYTIALSCEKMGYNEYKCEGF